MHNQNEILAMMEQYKQEGGDLSALAKAAGTLAAQNKTPLGLSQWVLTDKPQMEDFNRDNRIIDEAIRNLDEGKVGKEATKPFMPEIIADAGAFTYSSQWGNYKYFDDFCFYSFRLTTSNATTSGAQGNLRIKLPTPSVGSNFSCPIAFINIAANINALNMWSNGLIGITLTNGGNGGYLNATHITNDFTLSGQIFYRYK